MKHIKAPEFFPCVNFNHSFKCGIGPAALLALMFFLPAVISAAVPGLLHYSGYLQDGLNPVDTTVAITLRLYDSPTGTNLLYTDSAASVPVQDGVFNTFLGDDTIAGNLATALTSPEVWLEVVINGITLSPRQQVVSAPYAQRSGYADLAGDSVLFDGVSSDGFLRRNQPDTSTVSSSTSAAITIQQNGSNDGIRSTTSSTDPGEGALVGIAGSSGPLINSVAGVVGSSANYRGVTGSSETSTGVLGFSTSDKGVDGQSDSGVGVRAYSTSGNALQVDGGSQMNGDVTVTGALNHPLVPIAAAVITAAGTVYTGSGNVSCTYNATSDRYEIAITDENYYYLNYITQVTPMTSGTVVSTSSADWKLLVILRNTSGSPVMGAFQFVTFKP